MKKIVLLMLMFLFVPAASLLSVNAQEQKVILNSRMYEYLEETFKEKMENPKHEVSKMKVAYDFDDNAYIIVEGIVNGYMIYSVNSAVIVEFSSKSLSPFSKYDKNLFYGGPTFYYVLDDELLKHTILENEFFDENIPEFIQSSKELNDLLCNQKNEDVLAHINEGSQLEKNVVIQSNSSNAVENPEFFQNLNQFGYLGGGVCGFIGLNMLIAYHDAYKNGEGEDIMDDKYWANTSKTLLKSYDNSLTKYLYDLDPKDSTTSVHIHDVSKQYSKERGLSYNHTSRYKPFYTIATITNAIDRNTPVEVFGSLGDPTGGNNVNHAVVVYKYKTYKNFIGVVYKADYTAHYGWTGYNEVIITGIIGSIYFFEHE